MLTNGLLSHALSCATVTGIAKGVLGVGADHAQAGRSVFRSMQFLYGQSGLDVAGVSPRGSMSRRHPGFPAVEIETLGLGGENSAV